MGVCTVHATETQGTRYFMNWRIMWPSSTFHALSMRIAFLHFIKSRSAVQRASQNLQIANFLKFFEGVRICSETYTFQLCENLEPTKNRKIQRFIL